MCWWRNPTINRILLFQHRRPLSPANRKSTSFATKRRRRSPPVPIRPATPPHPPATMEHLLDLRRHQLPALSMELRVTKFYSKSHSTKGLHSSSWGTTRSILRSNSVLFLTLWPSASCSWLVSEMPSGNVCVEDKNWMLDVGCWSYNHLCHELYSSQSDA